MKVTGWTYWEDTKYKDAQELPLDEFFDAERAVIDELKEKGYKFSGKYHQSAQNGCPIIDDKYIYCVSMRKWGNIMQIAYDLPNEDGLGYVFWAWGKPEKETEKHPEAIM